jgi:hypothetical protein
MQEDRNQHYDDQQCACAGIGSKQAVGKVKSMFANTPKRCSHVGCCANWRQVLGPTISEKRQLLRVLLQFSLCYSVDLRIFCNQWEQMTYVSKRT